MNGGYAFDRRISLIFHRNEVTFDVIHGFFSEQLLILVKWTSGFKHHPANAFQIQISA